MFSLKQPPGIAIRSGFRAPINLAHSAKDEREQKGLEVKVLITQWCLTLCNLINCIPQTPLSMEFSRQEYWSELFSSPGDPPDPGIETPGSPALKADPLLSEPLGKPKTMLGISRGCFLLANYFMHPFRNEMHRRVLSAQKVQGCGDLDESQSRL